MLCLTSHSVVGTIFPCPEHRLFVFRVRTPGDPAPKSSRTLFETPARTHFPAPCPLRSPRGQDTRRSEDGILLWGSQGSLSKEEKPLSYKERRIKTRPDLYNRLYVRTLSTLRNVSCRSLSTTSAQTLGENLRSKGWTFHSSHLSHKIIPCKSKSSDPKIRVNTKSKTIDYQTKVKPQVSTSPKRTTERSSRSGTPY